MTRRILGLVLAGLAAFMLLTALVAQFYMPGALKKTPLNVVSTTVLDGTATYLGRGPEAVKAVSNTVTVGESSDSKVVVWSTATCITWNADGKAPQCVEAKDPSKRLVTASSDSFATDRVTGLAVNDPKYGDVAAPREGLMNKFPFDVEKKTYPVWDGVLGKAVDAKFAGEEVLLGMKTYRFDVSVPPTNVDIAAGVRGVYSDEKSIWIEPVTGSIVNQTERQLRKLPDGSTVADLDLAFTDDQVKKSVESTQASASQLGMVAKAPWITALLGLLAGIGSFLALRTPRGMGTQRAISREEGVEDPTLLDGFGDDSRSSRR